MILRGKDEYTSQDDEFRDNVASDKEESEGAYPCEGELLMIHRALNNQPNVNHESQRENIFIEDVKFQKIILLSLMLQLL